MKKLGYIGTYTEPILFGTGQVLEGKGKGIYTFEFDGRDGNLKLLGLSEGMVNPSYLVIDQAAKTIYAVNEQKTYEGQQTGTVSALRIGEHPWELQLLNRQMTMGTDPCHISLDKTGKFAAVANFRSGSITVYSIKADGRLGEQTSFVQHSGSSLDPKRQTGPHAHAVIFDSSNRYLLVPDLGLDKVMVYAFDQNTGLLTFQEKKTLSIAAGSGPRYLEQHPSGRFFYLVNELRSTITVLRVADGNFSLEAIQNISTLPDWYTGHSTCADLHISPSGEFLYASNRGHESIALFQIDRENGLLSSIGHVHTKGKTPRNFAIDPDGNYLLVANQDTDNIVVFSIDSTNGLLVETGIEVSVPTPVCIQFAPIYLT